MLYVCPCSVVSTLCNPIDCSPPGSSVHGILQVTILERVAISLSRGQPRDRPSSPVSPALGRQTLCHCATWAARWLHSVAPNKTPRLTHLRCHHCPHPPAGFCTSLLGHPDPSTTPQSEQYRLAFTQHVCFEAPSCTNHFTRLLSLSHKGPLMGEVC